MKRFERMKEVSNNHGLHGLCSLTLAVWGMSAVAATGTSGEFRMDLSGMGPWEMRTARSSEAISYSSAWATNALEGANAVVKVWPVKREKPKYIAIDLSGGTAATHYPIEYLDEIPGGSWSDEYKTSKLVLRHIPAGSFIMGGRATDSSASINTNLHMVTLTTDFYMGVFEVTQRQWELVMGNRPSAFSNATCYAMRPVESVRYIDIRGAAKGVKWPESKEVDESSFMGKLRKKSGLTTFDLPTEAQWEYACRAGTTTAYNSGKNLEPNLASISANAAEVARYWGNSGAYDIQNGTVISVNKLCATDKGTAIVGSYLANSYGLYDMHGNVWEFCLDAITNLCATGSIDPVGDGAGSGWRVYRGGSYRNSPGGISSANRWTATDARPYGGLQENDPRDITGFRLCLQGGEVPESTEGVELVNAAGEGTANWSPTKAGTYYLTHETQTNGVNGAELLGAWFEVAGPELTFTPDGDLVPGVKIAIGGAGEGWTVRYEVSSGGQGAARPTGVSPEYTAPITLNDSQTIRAIAFSEGGLESREFSTTYSLMSIGSAVAKPRYPWNGKVDIDCEVKGDANRQYLISLEAIDIDGSTNLPVRMVVGRGAPTAPQSQASEFDFGGRGATALPPGTYRFTWDADADIVGDGEFPNVAVSVKASGTAITGARRVVTFTVDGYTGTETLTNVPVLVRLSTAIEGFSYADFADANGGDMVFCDEGESVIYPHEIDEWHTDGESLVWVKLPEMKQGTKFKLAYGNPNYSLSTITSSLSPHEVWRDYAGVWHMNEDSGTAFDSTAHGLDALPSCGTNKLADVSQMVAYENGACGRARVNGTQNGKGLNYLCTPASYKFAFGGEFVVAGWFRVENLIANGTGFDDPRLISMKREYISQRTGFELQFEDGADQLGCKAQTNSFLSVQTPSAMKSWVYLVANFDDTNVLIYANGNFVTNGTIKAVIDDPAPIVAIGSSPSGVMWSLNGQYDEIRLRGGSLSTDRIKADYDMIKNRNFLSYGPVESGRGAVE